MFIPDPDFFPSRIPDPTTITKKSGEQTYFFVAIIFTKLKTTRFFNRYRTLFEQIDKELKFIIQEIFTKLSETLVEGSEILDQEKACPGSRIRIQGSKKHRIRTAP
jgi:lantibiotic modifying enzyme